MFNQRHSFIDTITFYRPSPSRKGLSISYIQGGENKSIQILAIQPATIFPTFPCACVRSPLAEEAITSGCLIGGPTVYYASRIILSSISLAVHAALLSRQIFLVHRQGRELCVLMVRLLICWAPRFAYDKVYFRQDIAGKMINTIFSFDKMIRRRSISSDS